MTTPPPFAPTIRTQAALQEAWHRLMGPGAFGGHSLWIMVIDGDHPLPQLTEITESEQPPNEEGHAGFVEFLCLLASDVVPGARFAFLRSRPGPRTVMEVDRVWARLIYDAARRAEVPCEVVHLATEGEVRPIPADDLSDRAWPA